MVPARLTPTELDAMTVPQLLALHTAFDAQVKEIRGYHAQINSAITAKEHAALRFGPPNLAQIVKPGPTESIADQLKQLPQAIQDEIKAFFQGGK